MVMSIARFNMVCPGINPQRVSDTYKAALDIAEYIDRNGFAMATLDEHHGADDGWMPSTLVTAGMLLARTKTMNVGALRAAPAATRSAAGRRGHRSARPRQRWPAVAGHPGPRLPARGVRDVRQGLEQPRQAFRRVRGRPPQGVDGRAVRVPGHHRAGHADAADQAASGRRHRRHLKGRRPPRRPIRPTVPAGPHRARPRRRTTTSSAQSGASRGSAWSPATSP